MDLSSLDRPEILETIFPIAYSTFYSLIVNRISKPDVPGYPIEVGAGVKIHCGFWVSGKESPSFLYFHGNGETVADYAWIAPFFNERGINLFVADYRGYGSSDGKPTISNLIGDAGTIFRGFKDIIEKDGFNKDLFIMGRSLGSIPAIEIAFNYQDEICGLVIESGAANNFRRLWSYLGISEDATGEASLFLNKVKIRQVRKPTLIMHGEYDQIISVSEGEELYQNSGASDKNILIVPDVGHNDIMMKQDLYFNTIEEFVKAHST